jgi:hypothetical protein
LHAHDRDATSRPAPRRVPQGAVVDRSRARPAKDACVGKPWRSGPPLHCRSVRRAFESTAAFALRRGPSANERVVDWRPVRHSHGCARPGTLAVIGVERCFVLAPVRGRDG